MRLNYIKEINTHLVQKIQGAEQLSNPKKLKMESILKFTMIGLIATTISFLTNFIFANELLYHIPAITWMLVFLIPLIFIHFEHFNYAKTGLFILGLLNVMSIHYMYGTGIQVELIYLMIILPVSYLLPSKHANIFIVATILIYIAIETLSFHYTAPLAHKILPSFDIKIMVFAVILLSVTTFNILEEFSHYQKLLTIQNKDLEENNEQIKRFNYTIIDDIKAPLRSIVNFSRLITTFDDRKKYDQYIDYIVDNGIQLNNIIDGINTFQKVDELELEKESIELEQLLDSVAIASNHLIKQYGVTIHTQNTPTISASRYPLFIVFKNLLDNTIKTYKNVKTNIYYFAYQEENVINIYMTINIPFESLDLDYFEFTPFSYKLNKSLDLEIAKKTLQKINGQLFISKVSTKDSCAFIVQLPIS